MSVVEFWPGAGWYTDILAPFLAAAGGKLYAAQLQGDDPGEPSAHEIVEAYRSKLAARPQHLWPGRDHRLRADQRPGGPGRLRRPGALPAQHPQLDGRRAWPTRPSATPSRRSSPAACWGSRSIAPTPAGCRTPWPPDGYVQQAYVEQLAKEAGFVLEAASEINANPKDTKDHPFGVWTLPPTRLSAPRGEPPASRLRSRQIRRHRRKRPHDPEVRKAEIGGQPSPG